MKLTHKQKTEYLKNPHMCPVCKSQDIEGGFVEISNIHEAEQEINCNNCDESWYDIYELARVQTSNCE